MVRLYLGFVIINAASQLEDSEQRNYVRFMLFRKIIFMHRL